MTEAERIAQALRYLQGGIDKALAVLSGTVEETMEDRWAAVYAEIPDEGLSLEKLRVLLLTHGFDPRAIGGQIRGGRRTRNDDTHGSPDAWYWRSDAA